MFLNTVSCGIKSLPAGIESVKLYPFFKQKSKAAFASPLICVEISKAVTANGDQWNEYFTVTGIEGCGFTTEVEIYNRWGALVYKSVDYQNDWNAFSHDKSIGGSDKVPTGTYYYIVKLKDSGLKPFAGPIYVATK